MWPDMTVTLGLDLAQSFDYTALVALEHRPGTAGPVYAIRMLERWRHRPYTDLPGLVRLAEERLRALLWTEYVQTNHGYPQHEARIDLVVDASGVGQAVVDSLVVAKLKPVPVIITGGFTVNRRDGGGFTVPKSDLVAAVQLLLEQRRLLIPKELPHAETLTRELAHFRYEVGASGHVRYGAGPSGGEDILWRGDGSHDDLILATALAAWYAEHEAAERAKRTVHVGSYLPHPDDEARGPFALRRRA